MGGICSCNHPVINELATDFVEALPALAEVFLFGTLFSLPTKATPDRM
jgi:hypothetical protein